MDLLENAVKSIELGVVDYRTGTHARLLSAVRNIHAGAPNSGRPSCDF